MSTDSFTFRTESGSTYEVMDDLSMIRRVDFTHALRRDHEWVTIREVVHPFEAGARALYWVEPLAEGAESTLRLTSIITGIKR